MESVAASPGTLTEVEALIDSAMTASGGSKSEAAKAIGVTRDTIKTRIQNSPTLKAKWVTPKQKKEFALEGTPTTDASIQALSPVAGEKVTPVLLPEKVAAEELIRLQKAMEATGMDTPTTDHAMALHAFYESHAKAGLSLLGGGIVYSATKLLEIVRRLEKEPYPDECSYEGTLLKSGMRTTDETILRCLDLHGRKSLEAMNMALMQQKLVAAQGGAGKQKRSKPGFQPMRVQVLAQPGSNLTIGEK